MQINKISSTNFSGLLLYKNPSAKKYATIDTNNIVGIQQGYDCEHSISDENTAIIVKNTFDNKTKNKYIIFNFPINIKKAIEEYNRACRNELGELGVVESIESSDMVSNSKLFE